MSFQPHLKYWIQYELAKPSDTPNSFSLAPLPLIRVIKLVSPKPFHQLINSYLELISINLGKLLDGKGPSLETRSKDHCTLGRVNLNNRRTVGIEEHSRKYEYKACDHVSHSLKSNYSVAWEKITCIYTSLSLCRDRVPRVHIHVPVPLRKPANI